MKKRFLLDVDGVLADFSGGALDAIEYLTGSKHDHEDIVDWSITSCPFFVELAAKVAPGLKKRFWDRVGMQGFCLALKPIAGAREMVLELAELGEVYACTAPFDSPTWMREREAWLLEQMGIPRSRVIFTSDKGRRVYEDLKRQQ